MTRLLFNCALLLIYKARGSMLSRRFLLTRSHRDEVFATTVEKLISRGNCWLSNEIDKRVFSCFDQLINRKTQMELEFENGLSRIHDQKHIMIKNRSDTDEKVKLNKEAAMEEACNQEKKRIILENSRKAHRKQLLLQILTDEKKRLLNEEKLAMFCDFYQNDTMGILGLAMKLNALGNIPYDSSWLARSLEFLFVNEQPLSLWNDYLDQLDVDDIKAIIGEWKFNSHENVGDNSTEYKNTSHDTTLPSYGRIKSSPKLGAILHTLITLNKAKATDMADFHIRGAILRKPYCKNLKCAISQDFRVIKLGGLDRDWLLKNKLKQHVSAFINAEIGKCNSSADWFLDDCPINLDILKALQYDFNLNVIFFITVPNEEIISHAVEDGWDADEIALELAYADHALPKVRDFFRDKRCPVYEVESTFGESFDPRICQLISCHLDELRKLKRQVGAEECPTDYVPENLVISHCVAKIGHDMLERLIGITEAIATAFASHLQRMLTNLRHQRLHIVEHLCECRKVFLASLRRPSNRQELVDSWQKEFNAMPLELLQDDATKAERHFRLHELVAQLCDLTDKRRVENMALLRDFFSFNEWYANERTNLINNYCLLLQMELDNWQSRNRVVGMLFRPVDNTDEEKVEKQSCYRIPMLKPPGFSIPGQAAESEAKRHQSAGNDVSKGKVRTITYTSEDCKADDGADCPQLLFVLSETLTANEMLSLTHFTTKAKEVKRIKRRLETKSPGEKVRRSGGIKAPSFSPEPNRYLLGGQIKPQDAELSFLYEVAAYALKLVQLCLTEEQAKIGLCVDDNGNPIPRVEELPSPQGTARSRSTKKIKEVKKAAPTPGITKEAEGSEELEEEKAIKLKLLRDEAEMVALNLKLIRDVGLRILAKFEENIRKFQIEGAQLIEAEHQGTQTSITSLKEYIEGRIERGEWLEHRLLLADNEPFCVSQEVTFTPKRLSNLHPFDQAASERPRPENDYFSSLLKLVDLFRREAPHGCICEKDFVELMIDNWKYDPMEIVRTFIVSQGTSSGGQSVRPYVDWRRFVVAAILRMLKLSSDQLWVGLLTLWSTAHEMTKSTLVGLRIPTVEVKKIICGKGVKLEPRECDLLIGLFETSEGGGQMVKMDDLALFLSATGCSSPFDSLVRSLAALQAPALPLPTSQTTQALYDLYNHPEDRQESNGDFASSKEVVQKIMDYVQVLIGSKECFPSDARLREMKLKEAFKEAHSTGISIHFLLRQPQFRALCSWMLPYLHFPTLPY